MATFDYPKTTLETYTGTNPRPDDFDRYWNKALEDLSQWDPELELVAYDGIHPRGVECFDLYFRGIGGARIHAQYLRPKGMENCPAALFFHGYSINAGDWSDKLGLVSQGIAVAALDVRGQGGKSEDPGGHTGPTLRGHFIRGLQAPDPEHLFYRSVYLDTILLARIVAGFPEVDPDRLGCFGASQGGALAIACAALYPQMKRVVSVHPFLSDFQRVWEMDLAKDAYDELNEYFRRHDPLHRQERKIFERLGYIDVHHLAPRVKAHTTMLISLMDTVCPPSTQYAVFNNLRCEKKKQVYPDFAHEFLPGMNDVILNEMNML